MTMVDPDVGRGEHDEDVFGAVGKVDGHGFPRPDAGGLKLASKRRGSQARLPAGVGEFLAVVVDECEELPVGVYSHAAFEEVDYAGRVHLLVGDDAHEKPPCMKTPRTTMPTNTFYDDGTRLRIPWKCKGDAGVEWLLRRLPADRIHHTVSGVTSGWEYTISCNFLGLRHKQLLRSRNVAKPPRRGLHGARMGRFGRLEPRVLQHGRHLADAHQLLFVAGHVAHLREAL